MSDAQIVNYVITGQNSELRSSHYSYFECVLVIEGDERLLKKPLPVGRIHPSGFQSKRTPEASGLWLLILYRNDAFLRARSTFFRDDVVY